MTDTLQVDPPIRYFTIPEHEGVGVHSAGHRIGARAAIDPIISGAAIDDVVAAATEEVIVTGSSFQDIRILTAGDPVVVHSTNDVLDAEGRIGRQLDPGLRSAENQRRKDELLRRAFGFAVESNIDLAVEL
jgi:hypothetical protein